MSTKESSSTSETSDSKLSPFQRNWLWFSLQLITKIVFRIWFRAKTRGMENLPANSGALLLINHLSFLDPMLVGVWLDRPVSYLARDSLFRVPIVGWILRGTYVVPINRSGGSTAVFREAIKRLKQGFLLGIFPEGTRSADGKLGRLKPGFLAVVRRADVPIIPVGIAGSDKALGRGDWFPKPRRIRVVIGKPLDQNEVEQLSQKGNESQMLQLISERITECQQQAQQWPRLKT